MSLRVTTGIALIVYIALLNVPYIHLMNIFDYDDILREPAAQVLTRYAAGGPELILTWLAFGVGALLFIPLAALVRQSFRASDGHMLQSSLIFGSLSAFAQACGLLRWAFVIPPLASAYIDPTSSEATRETILVVYTAVHQFGGVLVGEFLGQLLLAAWTFSVSVVLARNRGWSRTLAWTGHAISLLWIIAQTETVSTIIPSINAPELVPIAFIGWQCWLLALALFLVLSPVDPHGAESSRE